LNEIDSAPVPIPREIELMLHFEGDQDFAMAPQAVWARLSDARFLVRCIPGAESVSRAEPTSAACVIRPGFSFVRGTLEVTLAIAEAVAPTALRLLLISKGIGSSSTVEAALAFSPQGDGTRVHWTADVKELGGLLKAVPQGLIKASAQKVISDVWASVAARLAEEAA
jgi:carbon monoxide dehydrogenase subunit G